MYDTHTSLLSVNMQNIIESILDFSHSPLKATSLSGPACNE